MTLLLALLLSKALADDPAPVDPGAAPEELPILEMPKIDVYVEARVPFIPLRAALCCVTPQTRVRRSNLVKRSGHASTSCADCRSPKRAAETRAGSADRVPRSSSSANWK